VTTESRPLDAIIYDEVQEMDLGDMAKSDERLSASPLRVILRTSTANINGADIDYYHELSDQRAFHTDCGCEDGVVLADCWHPQTGPTCIDKLKPTNLNPALPRDEAFYVCPTCGTVLGTGGAERDPASKLIVGDMRVYQGSFAAHATKNAPRIGVSYPQMLSPRQTAGRILEKWIRRTDTGHFYRRTLAKPYTDPNTVPITEAICQAAERSDLRWVRPGEPVDRKRLVGIFLGIDHMKHDNHIVVKGVDPDTGKLRYLWLEVVQGDDPFKRTAEIMRRFRVDIACLEESPNLNEAWQFATEFPGRVFIARYNELPAELVAWGDRPRERAGEKKTQDDARIKWTVSVDQYRMMSWSLGAWVNGRVETPPAVQLTQRLRTDQGERDVAVAREFWTHLQRIALVYEPVKQKEGEEHARKLRRAVKKIRIDPHFAFANMLCDVALIRRFGSDSFLAVDQVGGRAAMVEKNDERSSYAEQLGRITPATTPILTDLSGQRPADPSAINCGSCTQRQDRNGRLWCAARSFYVAPSAAACPQYIPDPEEESYP